MSRRVLIVMLLVAVSAVVVVAGVRAKTGPRKAPRAARARVTAVPTITFRLPPVVLPAGETAIEWNCGTTKVIAADGGNGQSLMVTCTEPVNPENQYAIYGESLPGRKGRTPMTLLTQQHAY